MVKIYNILCSLLYCHSLGLVIVDNYFACATVHVFFVSRFFEIIQPFAGIEEMGKEVSLQEKN